MPENDHVAFIGLGAMGYPMAGHLQARDVKSRFTTGRLRRPRHGAGNTAVRWRALPLPQQDASIVFLCVGNDSDVMAVMTGDDGVLSGIKAGATLVDHTTTSRQLARGCTAHLKQDVAFSTHRYRVVRQVPRTVL